MIFKPNRIKHNIVDGVHEYSITMKIKLQDKDDKLAEKAFIKELFYPEPKAESKIDKSFSDLFGNFKGFGGMS